MIEFNKVTWYSNIVAIVLFIVVFWIGFYFGGEFRQIKKETENTNILNAYNTTYFVNGKWMKFDKGVSAGDVTQDVSAKEKTYIFGLPVYGDVDNDGDDDAVMFLINESGGSGVFYYVAMAINTNGFYRGTNAMYLGDRIAPQNINFEDGRAVANFADRKASEPFSVAPSVGKSVWIHFDAKNEEIGEWVKDFEGESNI